MREPSSNPTVLITGASRGLGSGIAQAMASEGCSIAINYVNDGLSADQTAVLCKRAAVSNEQKFVTIRADIATKSGRARLLKETLEKLGRIDALINNAGVAPKTRVDLSEASEESYKEVMSTNLMGPHFLTQAVVRHWLSTKAPSLLPDGFKIVFIGSVSAQHASTNRGEYCISKAGLAMVAQLWAVRLAAEGIGVFELRPGIMETDMTKAVKAKYDGLISKGLVPQNRWGSSLDVGLAVRSILVGDFPFSTGAVIPIDGGLHLRRL